MERRGKERSESISHYLHNVIIFFYIFKFTHEQNFITLCT